LKNGVIWGWLKFVSGYVERDKKNVEKFDFCSQAIARLIEKRGNLPRRIGEVTDSFNSFRPAGVRFILSFSTKNLVCF